MEKIMPTIINDDKVVLLVDFLLRWETVIAEVRTVALKIQREKNSSIKKNYLLNSKFTYFTLPASI